MAVFIHMKHTINTCMIGHVQWNKFWVEDDEAVSYRSLYLSSCSPAEDLISMLDDFSFKGIIYRNGNLSVSFFGLYLEMHVVFKMWSRWRSGRRQTMGLIVVLPWEQKTLMPTLLEARGFSPLSWERCIPDSFLLKMQEGLAS